DFDSQNSRYEFRYLYSRDTNGATQYYYTSPWLHLNEIGDILDSIDFEEVNENANERVPYIPYTPKVSVTETPDGQNTLFNDLIQLDIRVATIISATPTDTTWNYIESIQAWQVIESPRFTAPMSHQYSCFGENNNNTPIFILATVNRAYYPKNTYWSYAQYPDSNFTPMAFNGLEIESTNSALFNYRRSADYQSFIYTEDIALFNFVNEPDTIAIMAELKSLYPSCPSAYDTVLIYIKDRKTITLLTDNSNQTVCNGESMEAIQYEIGGGADSASIQWLPQPPNGITFTCTDHHTYTISGTSNMAGHYQYIVSTLQGENGSDCNDSVLTGIITINPNITLNPVSNQEVCNGSIINEIRFNSNALLEDSVTYTWLNSNTSIGLDSAGTSGISAFTASNDSIISVTSLITVTPIYTYNNKACPGTNSTFSITVNPMASITNKHLTICSSNNFSVLTENSDQVPVNTLYNWDSPIVNGISGSTSGLLSPTITGNLTNQTSSPIMVDYTVIPTSGNCIAQPFIVSVSVNPKADIQNISIPYTTCGGNFSITPMNNSNGIVPDSTMYSWEAPVVNGIFGTTSGRDTNGIYTNLTNSTDSSIQVTYSVIPTSGSCIGNPFAINIIVMPTPIIQNLSTTICSNTEFTAIPLNQTNGMIPIGTLYSWNTPDIVPNITGYTSDSNTTHISGILINDSSLVRTVVYNVTPQFNGCIGSVFNVSVQVNPRPYINPAMQNKTVCSGELMMFQNIDGIQGIIPTGTVYSWSAPIGNGINGAGGAYNNIPSMAGYLINTTHTPQSITYQVTPSAAGCTGNSYASIVTVYPTPQIQTINTAICNNGNFSILPVNGQNGIIPDNTTYSWSAPIVPGTSGETSGLGQISIEGTLTNNTSDPVTVKYTVQPFSGAIGNCMGDTFNINVTVYDQPLMNMVSNIRACPNSPVNIALGSEHRVAGQSFYWQNSNTSIGLGATGQGNISFTSTNLPIEEIGNITALPRYETSFGTCIGNPIYFQIFINPAIKVRVSDAHVCPNVGETELTATLNYIFNDYEATWNIPGLLEEMIHQNNASQHTDSITVPIPDTLCNQTYTTYLNIVDNIGCSATDTGTITIQNEIPQIIIPQP
ncbi:MAG: PKD-like domain-containing protein, partial [Bacteroidales bacterium]